MKRRNIALTLMATFCLTGVISPSESQADSPFDKLIPRGKLLKRLKDEFTGEDQKVKIPDPRRAVRSHSNVVPTPADRAGYARQPSQLQTPTSTRPLPPIANGSGTRTPIAANATTNRKPGFGMMLEKSANDQLVVTAVQRDGNAARTGMRPGDQLLSAGGGKLSNLDEFKQIAKSLGQGDQIEVEYSRQGKKMKSLLQYGIAPAEAQVPMSNTEVVGVMEAAEIDSSMMSVLDSPVEHVSRVEPIVTKPAKVSTGKVTSLNQTIEQQRVKMEAMSEELKLLRKSHQPAVEPTENNWTFPDLAGPGQN